MYIIDLFDINCTVLIYMFRNISHPMSLSKLTISQELASVNASICSNIINRQIIPTSNKRN